MGRENHVFLYRYFYYSESRKRLLGAIAQKVISSAAWEQQRTLLVERVLCPIVEKIWVYEQ